MRYKPCPHCGASNRARDRECYSCEKDLEGTPSATVKSLPPVESSPIVEHTSADKELNFTSTGNTFSNLSSVITILLSTALGGLLGVALDIVEPDIPFFLVNILLGVLCAGVAATCLCKFQEMHEGEYQRRIPPAAAFGFLVGLCLFAIWWTFDPPYGFPLIGTIAGFCSGVPVAVSFGLFGGESRPLGKIEFTNVAVSMLGGIVLGAFVMIGIEEFDFYALPGIAGLVGLIPTLVGGRVNLVELGSQYVNWSD